MKLLKKIFSINFWIQVDGNSVYDRQEDEDDLIWQTSGIRFFSTGYSKYLEKLGNNPDLPKEIIHFIHFKKNTDLENFASQIRENDFVVINRFSVDKDGNTVGCKVMRIDKTDERSIEEFTVFLCNAAYKNNGVYKKWEVFPAEHS